MTFSRLRVHYSSAISLSWCSQVLSSRNCALLLTGVSRFHSREQQNKPISHDSFVEKLQRLRHEMKQQSEDLKDMCQMIQLSQREVEGETNDPQFTEKFRDTKTFPTDVRVLLENLKAYGIRLSALQGHAHTLHQDLVSTMTTIAPALREAQHATDQHETSDSPYGFVEDLSPEAAPEVISETEVVLEPPRTDLESGPSASSVITETTFEDDEVMNLPLDEVTKYLHDHEIDFSDCFDAAALRQRYADAKAGTWVDSKKEAKLREIRERRGSERANGETPRPKEWDASPSQNTRINYGGNPEQGIMHDPYPGAERKMVDPMKFVWELKAEFGRVKNFDPERVDLWVGATRLEDHRRLYEYPQLQGNPVELRLKGDVPKSSINFGKQ